MIYYVVFALALIFFLAFNAFILPAVFLRFKRQSSFNERGVEIIGQGKGRIIIYCPDTKYQSYIKHYAVSDRGGKLIVKCETDKNIRYIDYDVSMYDTKGRIFKTRNVKEIIERDGYTKAVELDEKTAYVSVKVNKANDEIIKTNGEENKLKFSSTGMALYVLCLAAVNLASAFLIKYCVAMLFGDIFTESYLYSLKDNLITFGIGIAITVLSALFTTIAVKRATLKNRRVGKNG